MSEIRATDLDMVNLVVAEAQSCEIRMTAGGSYEIRSATLVDANLPKLALPYEIRSATLVKANLGLAEVGS
jgi:hypothetical protein